MTHIDKTEALLPCPFCGGGAVISQRSSDERFGYASTWTVVCLTCDAKQSATDTRDGNGWANAKEGETKSRAIAAWNRRAALPARGVAVKPLQWNDAAFLEQYAKSVAGTYRVFEKDGLWRATVHTADDAHFVAETEYLHEAKAAAQADYEARILRALEQEGRE